MESRTGTPSGPGKVEEIERELLLEGIALRYGHDLRQYDPALVRGVLDRQMRREGAGGPGAFLGRILREPALLERLFRDLCPPEGGFFRPAGFYRVLRRKAFPFLRTFPSIKAWIGDGAESEPVYSVAILLAEEIRRPFLLYATDVHETLLEPARQGLLPGDRLPAFRRNYRAAGGQADFDSHFASRNGSLALAPGLRRRIVFGSHCPATDGPFGSFQLIVCRNALSRYGPELRARALDLFHESLRRFGFLALGGRDGLKGHPRAGCYRPMNAREGLYQKIQD